MLEIETDTRSALRKYFGFEEFREGQRDVIDTVMSGKDVVVVMPTGSGKSLCYQLPALLFRGATVVVSPLIALMKDQVDALRARGLPATFINSSISENEQLTRIDSLKKGEVRLVYVAPERFKSPRFMNALRAVKVSLFAIDEAHCISTWGHDFRPDYLQLQNVIRTLDNVQTLALTATATPYVRTDIIRQLGLKNPQTFVSGFDRPNLSLKVAHTESTRDKISRILSLARNVEGPGIIYTATRKAVDELGVTLKHHGVKLSLYHAGLSDTARARAQDDFMSGRSQVILATNAFGMGIDKPDIRFVIHYQMPGSIEAYYQEIGRAGRDGLPSTCLLLFNYADKNTHDFFIEGSYPEISVIGDVYRTLWAIGGRQIEISSKDLAEYAGVRNEMSVQSALYLLERAGHIQRIGSKRVAEKRGKWTRQGRTIFLLDPKPMPLRIKQNEIEARAELERRKLREMVEFSYTTSCFRAFVLDYFGDRNHPHQCGSCSNCKDTRLDTHRSVVGTARPETEAIPRTLTDDELLQVRKILSCAKRMRGHFGKQMLAATLRGSAAKNVLQAKLNELSTYGLLKELKHDEVVCYIDALLRARCLESSVGEYPTVSITQKGERVMREQEQVELALPPVTVQAWANKEDAKNSTKLTRTVLTSYALFKDGLTIPEIAERRNSTTNTVEEHLIAALTAGLDMDVSCFVLPQQKSLVLAAIEKAGTDKLKSIRELLPDDITYNMIRFVLAEQAVLGKAQIKEQQKV